MRPVPSPTRLPFIDYSSPHVWDSTSALELREIPRRLLVIGGGYIGMEMGTVYAALGSQVTVVESLGSIIAAADPDLVAPVFNAAKTPLPRYVDQHEGDGGCPAVDGMHVKLLGVDLPNPDAFSTRFWYRSADGRTRKGIGLEHTAIEVDDKGFIVTDHQRRTAEPHIFAIGDVAGEPMLGPQGQLRRTRGCGSAGWQGVGV